MVTTGRVRTQRLSLRLHPVLLARLDREVASLCLGSRTALAEMFIAEGLERRALLRGEVPIPLPRTIEDAPPPRRPARRRR